MTNVVSFVPKRHTAKPRRTEFSQPASVVIFPGVRYVRDGFSVAKGSPRGRAPDDRLLGPDRPPS